jgi:hypothetical protein
MGLFGILEVFGFSSFFVSPTKHFFLKITLGEKFQGGEFVFYNIKVKQKKNHLQLISLESIYKELLSNMPYLFLEPDSTGSLASDRQFLRAWLACNATKM